MKTDTAAKTKSEDIAFMRAALGLAQRGLGRVWPNPSVGCVIVANGRVVGRGRTQDGGRPHAEVVALAQAQSLAQGATVYVTLEPCSHFGKTPPCVDALIAAGVARVVVAATDVDPRVAGNGIKKLQDSGIEVTEGVLEQEAIALNLGFFLKIKEKRPLFCLKAATSIDGKIALANGESKWITGDKARAFGHLLRAEHDAIMVGAVTAIADDPMLDCRLSGMENRSPIRIVIEGQNKLPLSTKLVQSANKIPVWLFGAEIGFTPERREYLTQKGVKIFALKSDEDDKLNPKTIAQHLAEEGITRVLIEGGGRLAAAFIKERLVDKIAWFSAPSVLGGDARPAIGGLNLLTLAEKPLFALSSRRILGEDELREFVRKEEKE